MIFERIFIMGSNISRLDERHSLRGSAQLMKDPEGTQNW